VRAHRARAGSVTVIDVTTGEVLAMVNQPVFNPNDRAQYEVARYKNRVATDIFEPGSSIKPFVVAAALSSNRYRPDSMIDTTPFRVGPLMIRDKHDLGTISLGEVLARSSNVGMSKLALSLDAEQLHESLRALGFGEVTASGFPGESAGRLPPVATWRPINIATISYGYGLSVTPLQLAQVSRELIGLLEQAVTPAGTGSKAAVPGYRVAGKTGTAWKAVEGGYSKDRYLAVFAGVVPASQPRLAIVVMIDEPSGSLYYGGDVSAPVFSAVASGALRLMAVAPDDFAHLRQVAHAEYEP
jgi:cell division protein FtsI (penicillin-binding protein 3)